MRKKERGKCACGEAASFLILLTHPDGRIIDENSLCADCIAFREITRSILNLGLMFERDLNGTD